MSVVVLGDSLLDIDLVGGVSRLCPDAPAPVIDIEREQLRPGGAGLAAALMAADGVPVTLLTAIAGDADGDRLRETLRDIDVIAGPATTPTPVKTRIRSAGQLIARMDRGSAGDAPAATDEMICALRSADAVLVADYGRGLIRDERLRSALCRLAGRIPVVWDPHPRGPAPVPGICLGTPNAAEALDASGTDDPFLAAAILRHKWSADAVAVTVGARGAVLDVGGLPVVLSAPQVPVADPCGAGDRFAGTVTTRLAAGESTVDAVRMGIDAATQFLADGGAAAYGSRPVRLHTDRGDARRVISAVRSAGGTVVATGGCFDLLHAGHARTLTAARALGDCLVVCLNSDRSVRRLKGPDRPLMAEQDRVELLLSLECVDAVAVFDEDDPRSVLDDLRPDVWVKGGDYQVADLPEADLVESWGGRAVVVPYHPGRSTSRLAEALSRVG
jgi:rfaE bifunctional protein nucleotidyltransferase chain/domain/rfaE bifunctional protein kinase chain/domain